MPKLLHRRATSRTHQFQPLVVPYASSPTSDAIPVECWASDNTVLDACVVLITPVMEHKSHRGMTSVEKTIPAFVAHTLHICRSHFDLIARV